MDPLPQIPCAGNCLVHLHSFSNIVWLIRRIYTLRRFLCSDGIVRFPFTRPNHQPTFLSLIETITLHFQDMKAAMERLGHPAQNFVAIIPASSNTHRYRSQLTTGATNAGMRIICFFGAPVLAASYYQPIIPLNQRTVLVFELDNHNFEVSLLTQDRILKVKAAVSDLGCPLFNYMVSLIRGRLGIDISGDADALSSIVQACERAKNAICSGLGAANIKFEQEGREVVMSITRKELVEMNLNHLLDGIMRCLMKARVRREAVDEIVFVGASTNIPEVKMLLRRLFEYQPFRFSIDPAILIELSAAQYLRKISARFNNIPMFGLRIIQSGIFTL